MSNVLGVSGGASTTVGGSSNGADNDSLSSWYEAMARAWGNSLDDQATTIRDLSNQVSEGGQDQPSSMIELTAQSLKMQFMSNNASTSTNSVGQALEALARKQ